MAEVGTGVLIAIGVSLEENSARGILGGIGGYREGFREVGEVQD